ncbi:MAG TPA: R3H domain-containing nucleic acid-binding protein [Caldisericia bacterium]|jgi:spoIIIJ-associated protein|nr:R3H domain-containing nucleic acid-binding protein [Caldisericia bacterium]HPB33532.1 R3H domain-containing nucleic acid-binding protein [Caldisericia bacterium]HQJ56287.1 R3H domain-containing nucleic acid-binding protein [Caldisericia bacterium]HQL67071.1 R3H domain-containing nucleic acid-binding protein [Caldisericia bacterium]HQN48696.1 R3H domain-containing nucleic acid-binding protein [Caldisericia bacterium]
MKTTIFNIKLSEKDTSKIVKGILGYIFEKLEEDVNFEIREKDTEVYVNIILSSKEKQAQFIGKQGKVLATLQYLLNSILHRNFNDDRLFIIDIGGYKQKQIDYLKNLAIEAAIKAKKTGKDQILQPMSAMARKIIHTSLSQNASVYTYSIGKEPNRRVVVALKNKNGE